MERLLFSQSSLVLDCNLYKLHHAAMICVNKNQFTLSKSVPPVTSGSPIRYFVEKVPGERFPMYFRIP